jgi:hypothetical protein
MKSNLSLNLLFLLISCVVFSQELENQNKSNEEISLFDYFKKGKSKPVDSLNATPAKPKKVYLSVIPVISSNPVVGVAYGGVTSLYNVLLSRHPHGARFRNVGTVRLQLNPSL